MHDKYGNLIQLDLILFNYNQVNGESKSMKLRMVNILSS